MPLCRVPRALSARAIRYQSAARSFATASVRQSAWSPSPAPPRLPREEQELFEKLQRESMGAFSQARPEPPESTEQVAEEAVSTTGRTPMRVNQSPDSSTESTVAARVDAGGKGEELHPNIRRGAAPEFEGEKNPKTGEMGGPKNEPLRWGHGGDWSYNGRVTDF